MISKNFLLSTCLALGLAASAAANTVVTTPAGAGKWYDLSSVTINETATDAFWDQSSLDGDGCNVGYWLASSNWGAVGPCAGATYSGTSGPGVNNLSFLGDSSSAAQNVSWEFEASNSQSVTLLLEVAGNQGLNSLGYYTYDTNDTNGNVEHHVLFAGPVAPGAAAATATITVGANENFGFFLCPAGVCGDATGALNSYTNAYYSGSGLGSSSGVGKFALFSEIPSSATDLNAPGATVTKYWVGVEDKPDNTGEGVGDFNDMLFTASVVPEPGFYAALALGLFGVFFYTWRRRQQHVENN